MILLIDTTEFDQVVFALATTERAFVQHSVKAARLIRRRFKTSRQRSFKILGLLEKFLQTADCELRAITQIVLVVGERSFTGMRVGLAIAQALSLALKLPVKYKNK